MANFKNITEVPEVEALSGAEKVLLNVDGSAKQARVDLIKPKEEWDLDLSITTTFPTEGEVNFDEDTVFVANDTYSYNTLKAKLLNGDAIKTRVCWTLNLADGMDKYFTLHMLEVYQSPEEGDFVYVVAWNSNRNSYFWILLNPDGTFCFD